MAKRLALTARTLQRCAQRCSSAKQLMARYLHTFLFRCPQCGEPVEVARKSDEAAREQLDAQPFSLVCLSLQEIIRCPGRHSLVREALAAGLVRFILKEKT